MIAAEAPLQCSAARCREAPVWELRWRNPRIHGADRVKRWLACPAHRASLGDYLESRGFPLDVVALEEAAS